MLSACDSGGLGYAIIHTVGPSSRMQAATARPDARQPDAPQTETPLTDAPQTETPLTDVPQRFGAVEEGLVLQCDASCPPECVILSQGNCLPTPEFMAMNVLYTGPNESVAAPPVLISREHAVQAQRTPISGTEAAKRLERAYRRTVGHSPSPDTLALLTAHWAHETNQGAAMHNYNFGGIKGVGPTGAYAVHWTREGAGLRERRRSLRFRAYPNAAAGAIDYVSLLQRLYGPALEAASRGDIGGFVIGLKQGGYFSGDAEVYLRKVSAFVDLSQIWGFAALGPSGISPKYKG